MNFKKWTTALMLALAVSSCIQDEALNSEAAIDACTGADVQLAHINSDSKEINIYVHKGANLAKQQLLFTLPDGATIKADEHSPNDILNNYDFSNESHSRTFTVTSEDGEWTATYTVKVVPAEMPETFHFEDLLPSAGTEYDIFYEFEPGTSTNVSRVAQWSSGNPGYKLTGMTDNRTGYPTQQRTFIRSLFTFTLIINSISSPLIAPSTETAHLPTTKSKSALPVNEYLSPSTFKGQLSIAKSPIVIGAPPTVITKFFNSKPIEVSEDFLIVIFCCMPLAISTFGS